jgi:hypothetical protein
MLQHLFGEDKPVNPGNPRNVFSPMMVLQDGCCVCVVLDGAIESALQAHNTAYGDQTKVSCLPLRTYEGFCEHVLGIDKTLTRQPYKRLVQEANEQIYWIVLNIGYRGQQ